MHAKRKETTMRNERDNKPEPLTSYRATVTDTISHEVVETFAFGADCIEDAREKAWGIAGRRYSGDIHVRVERISK